MSGPASDILFNGDPDSVGWDATPLDAWMMVLFMMLLLAVVFGMAYLRTRRTMYGKAAMGLGLMAAGIGVYAAPLGGWPIAATVLSLTGMWISLTSGVARPRASQV